jgi:hypothetical protein
MVKAHYALINGRVLTPRGLEEAIAIGSDRILRTGSNEEVWGLVDDGTRVMDLGGRSVLPGFEDSHIHLLSTAAQASRLDLRPILDMGSLLEKVSKRAEEVGEGEWVIGRGWDEEVWKGQMPKKEDLDAASPHNPVYIVRRCGHVAAVNSQALKIVLSEVDEKEVERDHSGEPTGIIRERALTVLEELIRDRLRPSPEEMNRTIHLALSQGITCVEEAGLDEWGLSFYKGMDERGELPIRINALLSSNLLGEALGRGIRSPHQISPKLRICGIKFFADGSLGGRTAALTKPYSDDPSTSGILAHDLDWFVESFTKAHLNGLQCCTHAIGDRANEIVLEANLRSYERIGEEPGKYRDRIEHCSMLSPDIAKGYLEQGMIASIQFSFASSKAGWVYDRIGLERLEWAFPWRKLLDIGVRCCAGSDSPVEDFAPLNAIQKMTTLWPLGSFTPEELIRIYTMGSAYAQFQDGDLGSLEKAKLADLIVLSGDIFSTPYDEIGNLKVDMTIVGGKIVYAAG